ncbi:MAG TPA: hypothetical protein ENJ00_01350 [Phycisphaerales bacterium]|nr:hypothetical protein [Phycisphaerales bacterium]
MTGAIRLGMLYALRHRVQTLIVSLCIAATVGLPVAAQLVLSYYQQELSARAQSIPLVAGSKGSRFDLALSMLYFRVLPIEPVPMSLFESIESDPNVLAIPVHLRFTASGFPLVAIGAEYFDHRGLVAVEGTLPMYLGDVVLGADVASRLDLGPGDSIMSDQRELYDLSVPPPLKMHIAGVLVRTGTADDQAVFTDIKTAWVLEGETHGHQSGKAIDQSLVLAETPDTVIISPSMASYNEIKPENIASFHTHGDQSNLPITGVMIFPKDQKAHTIIKARINSEGTYQAVEPSKLVGELFEIVFRIKAIFDWIIILMGSVTVLLIGLISLLAVRLRQAELVTLDRIGAPRSFLSVLISMQLLISLLLGTMLGLIAAGVTLTMLKGLMYSM